MSDTANLHPLSPIKCPTCGNEIDTVECVSDKAARPAPGDITLCMKCGDPLTFTEQLALRPAELKDMLVLNADAEASRQFKLTQTAIRRLRPLERRNAKGH